MAMNNALNVSELLKRLGVVGDSLGSAPILEEMRLSINLADLSDLVPPVAVPVAGASYTRTSGALVFNQASLHCRSPGGLTVQKLHTNAGTDWDIWISDADPFATPVAVASADLAAGQTALSVFSQNTPAGKVAPAGTVRMRGFDMFISGMTTDNWVGPGQFFNIEATSDSVGQRLSIIWKEYPGAINP